MPSGPGRTIFSANMRPWFPTFAGVLERAGKSVGVSALPSSDSRQPYGRSGHEPLCRHAFVLLLVWLWRPMSNTNEIQGVRHESWKSCSPRLPVVFKAAVELA